MLEQYLLSLFMVVGVLVFLALDAFLLTLLGYLSLQYFIFALNEYQFFGKFMWLIAGATKQGEANNLTQTYTNKYGHWELRRIKGE